MKTHLNTLFVTTEGSYLAKDGDTVSIRLDHKTQARLPFHNLDSIICIGRIGLSPQLMQAASQSGISISLLDERGRFRALIQGFTSGNVLLRREQYKKGVETYYSLVGYIMRFKFMYVKINKY